MGHKTQATKINQAESMFCTFLNGAICHVILLTVTHQHLEIFAQPTYQ